MQLLKNKKAVVTGGTKGIGKAIATSFYANGADVVILGTNDQRGNDTVKEIQQEGVDQRVSYYQVNVADYGSVEKVLKEILLKEGTIDILVNNAGITRDNLLMRMAENDWDEVIDVNLKSLYNTCRMVMRPMIKQKSGKIINISSVVGLTGNAGQVNYSASKAGMIGFTKSLAKEVAKKGVMVNCIAPGFIQTQMTEKLTDKVKEALLNNIPTGKLGSPSDVANTAVFLASSMSDYITGQVITVDGGMVM
jgi:3-oxoacyl-[acyl-carrier protein] reductase